ncbi:hypothetical protein [Priestia filamentosa]|uniref:hypothetical protein n=1 Tax=Priestia filamentosa TaxID=1402861 RepID=UPI000E74195B|nr:hypothetical protein [Priestia filamentosa]RJS63536.1 hypothetical protein CJ485_01850 [Priestia filamentosa]
MLFVIGAIFIALSLFMFFVLSLLSGIGKAMGNFINTSSFFQLDYVMYPIISAFIGLILISFYEPQGKQQVNKSF